MGIDSLLNTLAIPDVTPDTEVLKARVMQISPSTLGCTPVTAVTPHNAPANSPPSCGYASVQPSNLPKMSQAEKEVVYAWLGYIGEQDPIVIAEVLDRADAMPEERNWILTQVRQVLNLMPRPDERRRCDQCANRAFNGRCLAARRGEINAARDFTPVANLPGRCSGYIPMPDDPDQRSGRERWPGLDAICGRQQTSHFVEQISIQEGDKP